MKVIVMLKPDIIMNNEISAIKKEIEKEIGSIDKKTLVIKKLDQSFLEKFYSDYKNEDFFIPNIVKNMTKSPIIAMLVNVRSDIKDFDEITLKKQNIRKIFGKDKSNNSLHVSDSKEAFEKERKLFNFN